MNIAVFGDSVAWGQGLVPAHKFAYKVAAGLGQTPDAVTMCAHSGGIIGITLDEKGTSIDPEIPAPEPKICAQFVSFPAPETVDLVILTGGINDIGVQNIFNPFTPLDSIGYWTVRYCYYDMLDLLGRAVQTFTKPTCQFVLLGYYPILSEKSNPVTTLAGKNELTRLMEVFAPAGALLDHSWIIQQLIALSERFATDSRNCLANAVKDIQVRFPVSNNRVLFVDPGFTADNALFAPYSWIWGFSATALGPEDEVAAARIAQCGLQYPGPTNVLSCALCQHASVGHPNVDGADAYARAILAALAANPLPGTASAVVSVSEASIPIPTFRDPDLSLMQSAVHSAIRASGDPDASHMSAEHPMMQSFVAAATAPVAVPALADGATCGELFLQLAKAEIAGNTPLRDQIISALEDSIKDSTCDPRWALAVTTFLAWQAGGAPIPYVCHNALTDFVLPFPKAAEPSGELTVGIIGDWGTGTKSAAWLLAQLVAMQPDVIIHLGDIYYAGTHGEVRDNFILTADPIRGSIPLYSLAGNHDMYSGGVPYYSLINYLEQPASYFCLRNDAWQILALDTGFNDASPLNVATNVTSLQPSETKWHLDKISSAGTRKTILLSHHQLFSAFGDGVGKAAAAANPFSTNPNLYGDFGPVLSQIALWIWGHEHSLNIFEPYAGLARGRCVGASAVPVRPADGPYTLNPNLQSAPGEIAPPKPTTGVPQLAVNSLGEYYHAFAVLRLGADGNGKAEYYQIDSTNRGTPELVFTENI